jgi:hypothetical protein
MHPRQPKPEPAAPAAEPPTPEAGSAEEQDRRLDEELAETFPASDPIPVRHDS